MWKILIDIPASIIAGVFKGSSWAESTKYSCYWYNFIFLIYLKGEVNSILTSNIIKLKWLKNDYKVLWNIKWSFFPIENNNSQNIKKR